MTDRSIMDPHNGLQRLAPIALHRFAHRRGQGALRLSSRAGLSA